jgi:hypothetical protein
VAICSGEFIMPNERLFLDILYYESDYENIGGASLPGGPGRIYRLPKSIHACGARIARKLREYGFVAGVFDHLYVNYTTVLDGGQIRYSPREAGERIRYIDYGLSPERTNRLTETEKESLVCKSTFDILRFAAGQRPPQLPLVEQVASDIEAKGSELEIVHKTKETATSSVTVQHEFALPRAVEGVKAAGSSEPDDELAKEPFDGRSPTPRDRAVSLCAHPPGVR